MATTTKHLGEIYPKLCQAVGDVVLTWALVEASIDDWAALCFYVAGGKNVEDTIPRQLKRKADFLRKCVRFKSLAAFSSGGEPLIQRWTELSRQRHDLINGALHTSAQSSETLQFASRQFHADSYKTKLLKYSLDQLFTAADQMTVLARQLLELTTRMANHFSS
jgi:hypothetical protein